MFAEFRDDLECAGAPDGESGGGSHAFEEVADVVKEPPRFSFGAELGYGFERVCKAVWVSLGRGCQVGFGIWITFCAF